MNGGIPADGRDNVEPSGVDDLMVADAGQQAAVHVAPGTGSRGSTAAMPTSIGPPLRVGHTPET